MEEKSKPTHKPLFGRVIIKREIKEKSKGGLILPETATKKLAPCEGIIVALGPTAGWVEVPDENDLKRIQTMNVGDKVMFGRHAGAWIDATEGNDDGTLFICQDADILTVMEQA